MKKVIAAVVFMLLVAVFAHLAQATLLLQTTAKRCRRKIFPSESVTGIII